MLQMLWSLNILTCVTSRFICHVIMMNVIVVQCWLRHCEHTYFWNNNYKSQHHLNCNQSVYSPLVMCIFNRATSCRRRSRSTALRRSRRRASCATTSTSACRARASAACRRAAWCATSCCACTSASCRPTSSSASAGGWPTGCTKPAGKSTHPSVCCSVQED